MFTVVQVLTVWSDVCTCREGAGPQLDAPNIQPDNKVDVYGRRGNGSVKRRGSGGGSELDRVPPPPLLPGPSPGTHNSRRPETSMPRVKPTTTDD